jgi:hypothetical protein
VAMDTGLHRKQIRQEMFDPPDLKGGGAITLDDWQESYSEHMATVTVKMDEFYTLAHAATEQFKKFRLNQSKTNYMGEDGMQVNERLTMGNRRYVRQLDSVLTDETKPEPVRSIAVRQPPIQDDPVHEAPAVRHGGVPVRAEGVHDDQDDAWQGGQVAGNVRDDVQIAGDDVPGQAAHTVREGAVVDDTIVQAKEADNAQDDTNDAVVVGPEVPRDEEGGEDDPVQGIFGTGGRKSKMTKQELFDPGGGGGA